MAVESPGWANQNYASGFTAAQTRRSVFFGLGTAGGVKNAGDLAVTQNGTPNMSVNVATGEIIIPGAGAAQGLYYGFASSITNLVIGTADPTNPRIDTVCATVDDTAYAAGADDWKLQVIPGTPTAGATLANLNGKGTIPNTGGVSSILIAYVLVPNGTGSIVTADISDQRVFASSSVADFNSVFKTGTYTANLFDFVVATSGTFTVTSPAHRKGAQFGVINQGSGVLTVSAASGVIFGAGLGSAGSATLPLGAVGAYVVLTSDGTNWNVSAGNADSGWLAGSWSFANGWGSSNNATFRKIGNLVRFRGSWSVGTTTGNTTIATLPVGYRPAQTIQQVSFLDTSGVSGTCNIQSTGVIAIQSGTPSTYTDIDGISFLVD